MIECRATSQNSAEQEGLRLHYLPAALLAAATDTSKDLHTYAKEHSEFMEIGKRMLQQWEQGVALSFKVA